MISIFGGLLMIIGSIFTFRGEIFYAVITYLVADLAWIYLSVLAGNIFGSIVIIFAMILGIAAYWKMSRGNMKKELSYKV